MTELLKNLLNEIAAESAACFKPVARYYSSMDFLLFLKEDVSYRGDRVDPFLTVLWHPTEDRLVGIKLKGFRFIFERLKSILDLKDDQFLPVVKALEIAMVGGLGQAFIDKHEKQRARELYEKAKEVSQGAHFDPKELYKQAA